MRSFTALKPLESSFAEFTYFRLFLKNSMQLTMTLFAVGVNGAELPGQRLPNTSRHNHHEGAKNGSNRVRVVPGGPDRSFRIHGLLAFKVRSAWIGRIIANGGLTSSCQIFFLHQSN